MDIDVVRTVADYAEHVLGKEEYHV